MEYSADIDARPTRLFRDLRKMPIEWQEKQTASLEALSMHCWEARLMSATKRSTEHEYCRKAVSSAGMGFALYREARAQMVCGGECLPGFLEMVVYEMVSNGRSYGSVAGHPMNVQKLLAEFALHCKEPPPWKFEDQVVMVRRGPVARVQLPKGVSLGALAEDEVDVLSQALCESADEDTSDDWGDGVRALREKDAVRVLRVEGRLVASAALVMKDRAEKGSLFGFINAIALPGWRRQGFAALLLGSMMAGLRPTRRDLLTMRVRRDNAAGLGLAQASGFVATGEWRKAWLEP